MNLTLDYLKSNRKWLVRNLLVWGTSSMVQNRMLITEQDGSKRIMYSENPVGRQSQTISFSELVDSRGNKLPQQIANPVIMIIPRNSSHCYLAGQPSSTKFSLAHEGQQSGLVDILIMEVDLP